MALIWIAFKQQEITVSICTIELEAAWTKTKNGMRLCVILVSDIDNVSLNKIICHENSKANAASLHLAVNKHLRSFQ